ncbi:MAG: alpha/beta hydrolase [Gammaproteobacteria bacterium]|nr:alpha/beta hydrolase [Gammaproteobacteria bacterium]
MPTTQTDANLIHYDIRGEGTAAILFNHSGASSLAWSERFLETLAEQLTVVTFDYRGTGHSSPASSAFSLSDLAADGRAILEAEGIASAIVIGTSMGGAVAQEFALAYPDQVPALILLGTFAGSEHRIPPDPRVLELLALPEKPLSKVERMRRLLPTIYAPTFLEQHEEFVLDLELKGARFSTDETIARHGAATSAFDLYERLPSMSTRTLVIHGTADPIIPVKNGEILAGRIRNAEYVTLEGVGHLPAVEQPMEVAKRILKFALERRLLRASGSQPHSAD